MTKETRSKNACWSCHFRHKKCDEGQPTCDACEQLGIPCLGYEREAEWADGGLREGGKREELRGWIREGAKGKRRARFASGKGHSNSTTSSDVMGTVMIGSIATEATETNSETHSSDPLEAFPHPQVLSCPLVKPQAQHLLNYYHTTIFPSQFHFYNPSPSGTPSGAPSWLLPFITSVPPLYHTAICMASFCAHSQPHHTFASHHHAALKALRESLENGQREGITESFEGITEVLGCIVFLISLAVVVGDTDTWQVHLRAAFSLLPNLKRGRNRYIAAGTGNSPVHEKAWHFFTGVIAWYDILACASTRRKPQLSQWCVGMSGSLDIGAVMGCDNHVVITLWEVASLQERKLVVDSTEMVNCVARMRRDLENLSRRLGVEKLALRQDTAGGAGLGLKRATISHIFASAAAVFLETIVFDLSRDPEYIRNAVDQAIPAIKVGLDHDPTLLGVLSWPLCIVGCMALGGQREFFKDLSRRSEDVREGGILCGIDKRCFKIVRRCWGLRDGERESEWEGDAEGVGSTWLDAMRSLNMVVLFV
ncbi:fungal-specific transcription factor domain-containing protein [Amylocarpus encephaloides]|uniref:Fungal-specific transcription factor domain-containing protein n=1 Tax=Amylocarpus encephaloides TaxID=45428 RepID=A0A9P7YRV9_9HELO|nr:fungal-specific transcription factor domain-containing protein [Amylocarpus encephaloides]